MSCTQVWIETPTNPTLKVVDIAAVCEIAHRQKDIFVVVDNTFESAYFQVMHKSNRLREMPMKFSNLQYCFICLLEILFIQQRPLELGADIVYYSLTKYMNGHSDIIMGSVALNNAGLAERLKFIQNATGAVPSPFDCFLVNRRYVYTLTKCLIVK